MTASREASPSTADETELFITEAELIRELFSQANRNQRFRRGQADGVSFAIGETDRTDESDLIIVEEYDEEDEDVEYEEDEEDDEPEVSNMELTYRFSAYRRRKTGERPVVNFDFGIVGRHTNILLPLHIAELALNMPAREAQEAAGLVRRQSELRFTIASDERKLRVCEGELYFGDEDDVLFSVCSCAMDHEGIMYGEAADPEDSSSLSLLEPPEQYAFAQLRERLSHEPLSIEKPDIALGEWGAFAAITSDLELSKARRDLVSAKMVLGRINHALLVQAGIR